MSLPDAVPDSSKAEAREGELRRLPSVQALLQDASVQAATSLGTPALTALLRDALDRLRKELHEGGELPPDGGIRRLLAELHEVERPRLSPVINATGIIIHTNLGRAPVSDDTAAAMAAAAANAVSLELDPETNHRGGRMREISGLMRLLTGAESSLVVNNNAAAVLLVLSALAAGREVILSRGEAVEIGGGFRIPDVLRQSGARLVEVGTTNRTYARDYAAAITDQTAVLMKIHQSNFRIIGFTQQTALADVVSVGLERDIPVVDDQGSGLLLDVSRFGLPAEHTIGDGIGAGAALVTASGDKLLGGPQAGIIAGKATWVERIARHPLARAVRADKTTLAGLAATLRHYVRDEATESIPVWRMIAADIATLRERSKAIRDRAEAAGVTLFEAMATATPGGGSLPGEMLPSVALVIDPAGLGVDVDNIARRLRTGEPRVFGRIEAGTLLLDLRTVMPEHDRSLTEAVLRAVSAAD